MLMCLNPIPGFTGKVDRIANLQAVAPGGRLDSVVSVCQPLVVLACGKPVHEALNHWSNQTNVEILPFSHPLKWNGHGGVYDGPNVVAALQATLGISG